MDVMLLFKAMEVCL